MSVPAQKRNYEARVPQVRKTIKLRKQNLTNAEMITKQIGLSPVAARVLAARGHTADEKLKLYLNPTLREGLPDPSKLKNLDRACALVAETVESGGAVAICCDFDVDGLTGGSQLAHFFTSIGVRAKVFVPDRFEDGYGLNEKMIRSAVEDKFSLLIAVDYGTTNLKELSLAKKLGLRTIVVDHHHVEGSPPPCDVFINPNQRGCGFADRSLCAAGLAWYFLLGLKRCIPRAAEMDARSYLDLACLGTICDMVPLTGVNRVIAKRGLEQLERTERAGLKALKDLIAIRGTVNCYDVSFGIGPRINAAGRMVHGGMVIDLLTTSDSQLAAKVARQLNALNQERQEVEAQVKQLAAAEVEERGEVPPGILVWNREFHTGVIGIVAQRLVEAFYRPSAVLGADTPGVLKGSMRGIKGFSVVETLASLSEYLIKYGGHTGAGGFSIEEDRIDDFALAFERACAAGLEGVETRPRADTDTEVRLDEITPALVQELKSFAPFGVGNPSPTLLLRGMTVKEIKVLKDAHIKTVLTDGTRYISGLMWRHTEHPALVKGGKVDIACRPDVSSFNGASELQVTIEAAEPAQR